MGTREENLFFDMGLRSLVSNKPHYANLLSFEFLKPPMQLILGESPKNECMGGQEVRVSPKSVCAEIINFVIISITLQTL